MKVWLLDYDPFKHHTEFVDHEDYSLIYEMTSQAKTLQGKLKTCELELKDYNQPTDFLGRISGALIINGKAKELFNQFPNLNVELLPLNPSMDCYILNALTVLDCVNGEESLVDRVGGRPDGRLMGYKEISLYEDVVKGHDMFRIQMHEGDRLQPYLYVSDQLKEWIETHLTGYQLIDIWDSEFSWQQQEAKYESLIREVDASLAETFNFGKASKYVEKNIDSIIYSGKWAMKVDENREVWIGRLTLDGTYEWDDPTYLPPVLLNLTWGIKEKRTFSKRLRDLIPFY
ncbi:imm11 family protein [Paenibacillus daejeonensis]|uniref:imm11 family protein n=1 Tax=Paenibacillus daejeonensis TaxID=135193 RepID=UPI000378D330|nr:DUF1629 domain-containing protein [Paenibacillus daejeonensis]